MPTPKKLRDARNKGQVCTSKDVVSTAILIVLLAILGALGVMLTDDISNLIRFIGMRVGENDAFAVREAGKLALIIICKHSFLFAAVVGLVAIRPSLVQVRLLYRRVKPLLEAEAECSQEDDVPTEDPPPEGDMAVDGVSFAYDGTHRVLDNVTIRAKRGETLAGLKDVTKIVIAHRLSTVRMADSIYVLDGGRIAEEGTFDELMANGGVFTALARRQM